MIKDSLLDVKNAFFHRQFQKHFKEIYSNCEQQKLFKEITNNKNPLCKLINLDKKAQYQSMLVHDLIQAVCDEIEVTKDELMDDIFNKPTKLTFTYTVLFEDSFNNVRIRMKIIKQLTSIWEDWEKNSCKVAETQTWNRLKDKQRQIVCDIWTRTEQIAEKIICFEQFINEANRKVQTIIKIKKNIALCINYYCQDACDKNYYFNLLQKLDEEGYQKKVEDIQLPKELSKLKPFADHLTAAIESHAWRNFLEENKKRIKCKLNHFLLTDTIAFVFM